jgi:uncharacterized protein
MLMFVTSRSDQLDQQFMNTKKQMQLAARMDYLEERLRRIQSSLDVYSQSTDTYVAANWAYQDDSKMSKNLNSCISAARKVLVNASTRSFEKPRAMTIVPIFHSNSEGLLLDQDSPMDSWVGLFNHASSSAQPLSGPRSPIDMLSPISTTHGFLQGESEAEGEIGWAHDALRTGETSVPLDPFLDCTSSRTGPSVDTSSTAPTNTETNPEVDPPDGRKLSSQAQEAISSRFSQVRALCATNDYEKAASEAVEFLRTYTPHATTVPHESEIRNNVIRSGGLGLAGAGHGFAPLHFFVSLPTECTFEILLLIDDGVDVNAKILPPSTDSGSRSPCNTALQLAAERGHANITALLASSPSIDLEVADTRGLTALFIAWRRGHVDCVEELLHHGALSAGGSVEGWRGNSLLHGCAWLCQPTLVRLLLARGADVNARNAAGSTPLIAAAISSDIADARLRRNKAANCVPVMKMLLDAGANFRLRNHAGHTAMYYAERERNLEAVALLEGRGAKRAIVEAHPLHPPDVVVSLVKRVLSSPTRPQIGDMRRARTMST